MTYKRRLGTFVGNSAIVETVCDIETIKYEAANQTEEGYIKWGRET